MNRAVEWGRLLPSRRQSDEVWCSPQGGIQTVADIAFAG
jgi:hypothetical protein